MLISESYRRRLQVLAGIITEVDLQTKTNLLSKSGQKIPFSRDMMKRAIEQGREIGMSFQSDNDKYTMPVSKFRVIRPYAMGISNNGDLVVRGMHVLGQSEKKARETGVRSAEAEGEWRLFKANNIKGMWETGRFFDESAPGYNSNDQLMRTVEVSFNPTTAKNWQQQQLAAATAEEPPIEEPETAPEVSREEPGLEAPETATEEPTEVPGEEAVPEEEPELETPETAEEPGEEEMPEEEPEGEEQNVFTGKAPAEFAG